MTTTGRGARREEADEFEAFVAASSLRLRRLAFAWSGDWHLADDLVQRTYEKLFRSWQTIKDKGDPFGYARTTLLRTLLADRRLLRAKREVLVDTVPEKFVASTDETNENWIDMLRDLPPRQRAVALLRYVEGLSVRETAHALEISEGTVKSQAHDAIQTLRQHMNGSKTVQLPSGKAGHAQSS